MAFDMLRLMKRAGILSVLSIIFVASGCRRAAAPAAPSAPGKTTASQRAADALEADRTKDSNYVAAVMKETRRGVRLSQEYAETVQAMTQCVARVSHSLTGGHEGMVFEPELLEKTLAADAEWQKLSAREKELRAAQAHQVADARALVVSRIRRENEARQRLGMPARVATPPGKAAK